VRVVGLGAICDVDLNATNDERQNSFRVSEFALLESGERVFLHAERGYTGRVFPSGDIWEHETGDEITRTVMNVVLPDPEDGEPHPWEWLAELAQAQGIDVTAGELRSLPYEVLLGESVIERLPPVP
jgi:hypothetical protein